MATQAQHDWLKTYLRMIGRGGSTSSAPAKLSEGDQATVAAGLNPGGQSVELDDNGQSLAPATPDAAGLALKQQIRQVRSEATGSVARYDAQKDADSSQGIVSTVSHAMKSISNRMFGDDSFKDPGEAVWDATSTAQDAADSADAALGSGDSATAATYVDQARDAAGTATRLADGYTDGMASGAQDTEVGLKGVKFLAEGTEAVLATVATGGAAGALASGTGTAGVGATTALPLIGEVSTATAATVVSAAQGIGETVAPAIQKLIQGDAVDWVAVGVDVIIQGILAKFGGDLSQSLSLGIAKQLAGKFTGHVLQKYLPRILAREVLFEGSQLLKTAAQEALEPLRGQKVTLDQIHQALLANMLDGKGAVIAAVTGGVEAAYTPSTSGSSGAVAEMPNAGVDAEMPDVTEHAVLLEDGAQLPGDAEMPDATEHAVLLEDGAQPPQGTAAGSTLPPPTIAPRSAASAANAELAQMSDEEIEQSVDNWNTGETPSVPAASMPSAAAPAQGAQSASQPRPGPQTGR
jgi:hypothetical protein